MLFWFSSLARQYKKKQIPTGFARVLEPLVLYVRDEIARPNIGEKHYRRFTGYLLTNIPTTLLVIEKSNTLCPFVA